ncbi:hypothetical protein [Nocardia crassostreae]|uniref:hypothetical protein n=1 Tax=Nocardia crassostreae TaxID=53428 RepID=UPI00082C8F5A|nr:hypothetical protein [Nocardia crassostreae]
MTTLLVILIVWALLSVPAALLFARMFRSTKVDRRARGEREELSAPVEFGGPADESTSGPFRRR